MSARTQAVRQKKTANNQPRPWAWFACGSFIGALAVLSLQFAGMVNIAPDNSQVAVGTGAGSTSGNGVGHQDFEFWTRLPNSEVMVPEVPEYASGTGTAGATREENYILQAGSFRTRDEADRLRAQLILLGLDVQIEQVNLSKGDRWHRVQTGPFTTRREVNTARNRLAEAGIEVIVLKRKKTAE